MAPIPDPIIEAAARAAYETSRPKGSHLAAWDQCDGHWRESCRREQRAAFGAIEALGYRVVGP
jgi:hypothetical protein